MLVCALTDAIVGLLEQMEEFKAALPPVVPSAPPPCVPEALAQQDVAQQAVSGGVGGVII